MPLIDLDASTTAFFTFSFAAVAAHGSGGSFTDNTVLGSAALFYTLPRALVDVVFHSFPLLAPLALVGFLYWFVFLQREVGEAVIAASVIGAIALLAGA